MLEVFAKCSGCGPGDALANVGVQVPALSQICDEFGCFSKFLEHQTLLMVLCLVVAVLSRALELPCFSNWVLERRPPRNQRACRRERIAAGVSGTKRIPACSNCPCGGLTVEAVLSRVCQGNVGGCEAWDVLVAFVRPLEGASTVWACCLRHLKPCTVTSLWPRQQAQSNSLDLTKWTTPVRSSCRSADWLLVTLSSGFKLWRTFSSSMLPPSSRYRALLTVEVAAWKACVSSLLRVAPGCKKLLSLARSA